MVRSWASAWFEGIAEQIIFERDARLGGITFDRELLSDPSGLAYRFAIDVPVHDHRRIAQAVFKDPPPAVRVWIDGAVCLRHRWPDSSLCMWFETDPVEQRWTPEDGLLALAVQVEQHAYCEAECRAGNPWPKSESPGTHPRPANCPCC
jgi:hypothetical protein